jgi:hypothetical protein
MATTVTGLFNSFSEAQHVIHMLVAHGMRREAISLVVNRERTSVSNAVAVGMRGVTVDVGPASRGQPAALIELGVPTDEAQQYAEGIGRGGACVSVTAADHQVDQALALIGGKATAIR